MSNTDNTLPKELKAQLEQAAKAHSDKWWEFHRRDKGLHQRTTCRYAYIAGATEYAPYKVKLDHAIKLLQTVKGFHETGLLPDRFIYNEIKSFLDGTK